MPINKDGSLSFNMSEISKGQGSTPFVGLGNVRNVNLIDIPGVARIGQSTVLVGNTVGLPTAFAQGYGYTFAGTENGTLYSVNTLVGGGGTTVIKNGLTQVYDLKIIDAYLWVSHGTTVSLYGPLTSGSAPQWFPNWMTTLSGASNLVAGYNHPILMSKGTVNNIQIVYVGNAGNIVSVTNFASASTPTATYNTSALALPNGQYCQTLQELGVNLCIGTQPGTSMYDVRHNFGNVYFWDQSSTTYNLPQIYVENGINQLLQLGNQLYVAAGTYGNIYLTNTVNFNLIQQIPFNYQDVADAFVYPNAISKLGDEIVFGTSTGNDSFGGGDFLPSTHGVWVIRPQALDSGADSVVAGITPTNGITYLRNTISTGNVGATQTLKIGAIYAIGGTGIYKQILIGWQDGSTYGIDIIQSTPYAVATLESPLYQVGSILGLKTFQKLEYSLASALVPGQTINVNYRTDINNAWTSLGSFTSSNTMPNRTSFSTMGNISNAEVIQLQVLLEQVPASGQPAGANINFKEVRLI